MDRLVREDRLAHGYVVEGDPLGAGKLFALDLIVSLFAHHTGTDPSRLRHRIEGRMHPDVRWVEPRGALRQIMVLDMDAALRMVQEKSFEGGWKAVVFLAADRLNPSSGNKLLKSLEEPPPRTVFLLVTDSPEQLLPTLRSRCQFLRAPRSQLGEAPWMAGLMELLRSGPPRNLRMRLLRAALFRDFLTAATQNQLANLEVEGDVDEGPAENPVEDEALEKDEEKARLTLARRQLQGAVMETVEAWYRDLLALKGGAPTDALRFPAEAPVLVAQAETLPLKSIFKLLENLREASRRLDTNLPIQVVFEGCVF